MISTESPGTVWCKERGIPNLVRWHRPAGDTWKAGTPVEALCGRSIVVDYSARVVANPPSPACPTCSAYHSPTAA